LCAASHFIDEDSDVGVFVAGWNDALAEDRKTPPEAISVDTTSGFTTHKIIDRILRRAVGSVRSLPLYRAHKPMFAPYPEEIETALTEGTVHEAFEKLFKQMIA
jgi:hypothetical protein